MLNDVDMLMDAILSGNTEDYSLNEIVDNMFLKDDEKRPERFGLHLTDVTKPFKGADQFCIRQHTLGKFYKPAAEKKLSPKNSRNYKIGWYIHLMYQQLFKSNGYAVEIENTRLDPIWQIYHTPDIIAKFHELDDDLRIIEIKSMGTKYYQEMLKFNDPYKIHKSGYIQSQMYMFLTEIKKAVLLLHDKNTSAHREVSFDYDPEFVKPYVHRLNILSQAQERYEKGGQGVPKRLDMCTSKDSPRSKNCPMQDICWMKRLDREKFRLKEQNPKEQINSSLIHEYEG